MIECLSARCLHFSGGVSSLVLEKVIKGHEVFILPPRDLCGVDDFLPEDCLLVVNESECIRESHWSLFPRLAFLHDPPEAGYLQTVVVGLIRHHLYVCDVLDEESHFWDVGESIDLA